MLDAKSFADLITVARGLLGTWMLWLGLTQNRGALPIVIPLMVICWTGDFVDGTLAHHSRHPRRTWIGDHDVHMDTFVSVCLGAYMIGAGYVGFTVGCVYLVGWIIIFALAGLERNLLMLAQTPIYLTFILTAMHFMPDRGLLLVVWVLTALAINWQRFSKDTVPKFIARMKSYWDGHGKQRPS